MRLDADGRYNAQDTREKLTQTLQHLGVDTQSVAVDVMTSCVEYMRDIPRALNEESPFMAALNERIRQHEISQHGIPSRTWRKVYR